jgi:uncharacterized protein (DUF1330 family)
MTAYLIIDLDIHDKQGYEEYRLQAPKFVAKHGGEYLARGGDFEAIEGDWRPHRLALLRFPNRQAIRDLVADPEYAKIAAIRLRTAKTHSVAVDGVE